MIMRRLVFIFGAIIWGWTARAQDPEFSQYYAAPLYLNPAFTGSGTGHRFIGNYRNQWPNVPEGFVTHAFSYDLNLEAVHSGVGFLFTTDKAGTAALKSTQLNFQYAYRINFSGRWVLSSAVNFGFGRRSIDYDELIFGDQLSFDATGNAPTDDPAAARIQSSGYFDFGAGGLLYNKKVWLGFSVAHLNEPNRSLIDEAATIPMKTSIHGGIRFPLYRGPLKDDHQGALAPSFVYKRQGRFDQFDLGAYYLYEPVIAGLWYRGIPLQQSVRDHMNQDAIIVILGFRFERLEVLYSYDVTVSQLGPISGGAHEIALKYQMETPVQLKNKKREKPLPCPTFLRD